MQVYRDLDLGTAKPDPATRRRLRYHLIDLVDPEDAFTVAEFQRLGVTVLDDLERQGVPAVIVGGSGLHFRSLVDPLRFQPSDPEVRAVLEARPLDEVRAELLERDPEAGSWVDLANPRRVVRAAEVLRLTGLAPSDRVRTPEAEAVRRYEPIRAFRAYGLDPGDRLVERVARRFDAMMARGLLDEVARVAPRLGPTARQGVGYKELLPVVAGEVDEATGRARAIAATSALAKRQRTFFRRDPRIRWTMWDDDPDVVADRIAEDLERAWTS